MGNIGNGYVYLMKLGDTYKIGRTTNIEQRTKELQAESRHYTNPDYLRLIHVIDCVNCELTESQLHSRYRKQRCEQVFEKGGIVQSRKEWFVLSLDQVEAICAHEQATEETFANPGEQNDPVTRTVHISTEAYDLLGSYIARMNRQSYPRSNRVTKQKIVERAIIAYLEAHRQSSLEAE